MRDDHSLSERTRAAMELREAETKVQRHFPESREKDFVLRNIRQAIAELDGTHVLCRDCGQPFTFDAERFRSKGLSMPRRCYDCRKARAVGRGTR
jgi:hypothetical protein